MNPSITRAGLALAALAALSVAARSIRADRPPVYALTGARVVTVSGAVLDNGTVVLRDGLIHAVGAGLAPPADARTIDATGLVVTPGLIDGFGGIGLPSASPSASPSRGAS